MSTTVNDWSKKYEAISRFAKNLNPAAANVTQVIRHFRPILFTQELKISNDEDKENFNSFRSVSVTIRNWIKESRDGKASGFEPVDAGGESTETAKWLADVASAIGYDKGVIQFVECEFITLLEDTSSDFKQVASDMEGGSKDALHVYIRPSMLQPLPKTPWDADGVVDQKFMYSDRKTNNQWINVRETQSYGLSKSCQNLTPHSAKYIAKNHPKIDEIVFLGGGSPEKEKDFIANYIKNTKIDKLTVHICDSSIYMMTDTYNSLQSFRSELKSNVKFKDRQIDIRMHLMDFTDPYDWSEIKFSNSSNKIFVILGCTFGNVYESGLFDCLDSMLSNGDLILIGGSFYDSLSDLNENGESHVESQYGFWARSIALNSVEHLLDVISTENENRKSELANLNADQKANKVGVSLLDAQSLPEFLRSEVPNTKSACFFIDLDADILKRISKNLKLSKKEIDSLAKNEKLYILSSKRYVVDDFCEFMKTRLGVSDPVIKDYDNLEEDFPYYHLAFERPE